MRMKTMLLTLAALVFLGAAPKAKADLALDLNTGGGASPCGSCGADGTTFGWSFSVNDPITVDAIGLWDAGSAPLGTSLQAGIFDSMGNLLASVTISDSSTPVASASTDGQWLFENISPITLTLGDYEIGSLFFDTAPLAQIGAPFVNIPAISVLGGVQGPADGGFQAPESLFSNLVFGPTFETVPATVPEPNFGILLAMGLAAIGLIRTRAKFQAQRS
jgi:hypothetical protein